MGIRRVVREYLDAPLRRVVVDASDVPAGWTGQDAADFRLVVQCAQSAENQDDLRNLRVLRISPLDGELPDGLAQATFMSGRTVDLTFKEDDDPTVVFSFPTADLDPTR